MLVITAALWAVNTFQVAKNLDPETRDINTAVTAVKRNAFAFIL